MKELRAEERKRLIKKHTPRSRIFKNSLCAFFVGGLICLLAEGERQLLLYLGTDEALAPVLVSLSFILIGSLLTAFGVFDRIARHAGAGTLVPITGFSNAVTSEAIDARSEGRILGVGSRIFTVAGPVILYGVCAGAAYGVIYYFSVYLLPYLSAL